MRKLLLILAFGLILTMGAAGVASAHDGPHPYPYCGHANHYSNYDWGYGSYGAYKWEGYLGHGDYPNHLGGTSHWHLYETWFWDDYWWDWFFWDYRWAQC